MAAADNSWAGALLPRFLDLTASRQIEIDIERGNLEAGHDPLSAADEIGKIAHKISGTAATFGFGTLGKQAQAVESICENIRGLSGPTVAEVVQDRLLPALDLLTQEFDVVLVAAT